MAPRVTAQECPACHRILIPQRNGTLPPHYADPHHSRSWCRYSAQHADQPKQPSP